MQLILCGGSATCKEPGANPPAFGGPDGPNGQVVNLPETKSIM
jgi:hypothetical protein